MRRFVIAAAASCWALSLGGAQAAQRSNPCYWECQYRCYVAHPGGGPAWQECYLACARGVCGAVG